ncbi:MAG: flippase [Candidatus Acidiferrales bacterium]
MSDTPRHNSVGDLLVKNIATLFAGRGMATALSAVSAIILARYLGREQLGRYGAIYAYLALFAWLGTFGIEPILSREASQHRDRAGSILFTGSVITAVFSFCTMALLLSLAPHFGYGGSLWPLLLMASIDALFFTPFRLPGIVFQVDLRQWYAVSFGLIRQLLWIAAIILLALGHAALFWVVLARTLCGFVETALTLGASWHIGLMPRPWRFLPGEARKFLIYCSPIAVSALAINVYHRIDQVMLHDMSTDQILGGYVAAVSLAEIFSLFPVALMDSIFPVLAKSVGDKATFDRYMQYSFRSLMVIAFAVCAIAVPLSAPLTKIVFGAKYAATAPIFAALVWSEVAVFFGVVMKMGIIARNQQRYLAISTIIGAIINVVLNIFWIPRFGALGATWATNISYAAASIFIYFLFRETRPMALLGSRIALPGFLLSLAVAGVLAISPFNTFVRLGMGIVLFSTGAWFMGVVGRDEIHRLWRLVGAYLPSPRSDAV